MLKEDGGHGSVTVEINGCGVNALIKSLNAVTC